MHIDKKICTKCNKGFPNTHEYFNWYNKKKKKLLPICKTCHRNESKKYYNANKRQYIKNATLWRKANPEKVAKIQKKNRSLNIEQIRIKRKLYYKRNRIKTLAVNRKWRERNYEKAIMLANKWWKENPDKNKQYKKLQRKTLKGNLNSRMSRAIHHSLQGNKNGRAWELLVGYTLDDLKKHIEKLFDDRMSWGKLLNGEIHIDHKTPIKVFNFTKPEHIDFKKCWALSNLQPMWAIENMAKGAKLTKHFQPSLQM